MCRPTLLLAMALGALLLAGTAAGRGVQGRRLFNSSSGGRQDSDAYTMFVQLAEGAVLEPLDKASGTFNLTLTGATPLVFTFKDRPDRQTGVIKLATFLERFPMPAANPPNAALTAAGNGSISPADRVLAIVTLADPVYDAGSDTVTFTAQLLDGFASLRLVHKVAGLDGLKVLTPGDLAGGDLALEDVSLFIDDCNNYVPNCYQGEPIDGYCTQIATAKKCGSLPEMGMCWHSGCSFCEPCNNSNGCQPSCGAMDAEATDGCYNALDQMCNSQFDCCYTPTGPPGCAIGCYGE